MADTIPADNHAIGDSGHVTDHNNVADILGLLTQALAQLAGTSSSTNATNVSAVLAQVTATGYLGDSWQNIGSYANGWGSSITPQFRLTWDRRSVFLTGQFSQGTTFSDGSTIATLPTGYRPSKNQWMCARRGTSSTDTDAAIRIDSSGVITCWGIVTGGGTLAINGEFPIDN